MSKLNPDFSKAIQTSLDFGRRLVTSPAIMGTGLVAVEKIFNVHNAAIAPAFLVFSCLAAWWGTRSALDKRGQSVVNIERALLPSDAIPDFASNSVRRITDQLVDSWQGAELALAQGLVRWYKETFRKNDPTTGIGRDSEMLYFVGSIVPRMAKVEFVLAAAGTIVPKFL